MIANYHTHTPRCHHARGTEREYIESARAAGMQILGFSDHCPYVFRDDYYSDYRMTPEDIFQYYETLSALREEYRGQIEIKIGFEAEYYPLYFADFLHLIGQIDCDYLLLGQHYLGNEIGCPASRKPTDDESLLALYTSQVLEGLNTGCFTYLAHPDLFQFTGSDEIYRHHIRPFCREIAAMGIPMEINMLGIAEGRHYPSERFFRIAAEEGNRFILGVDAHKPERLANQALEEKALAFCHALGIVPMETVALIPPMR